MRTNSSLLTDSITAKIFNFIIDHIILEIRKNSLLKLLILLIFVEIMCISDDVRPGFTCSDVELLNKLKPRLILIKI